MKTLAITLETNRSHDMRLMTLTMGIALLIFLATASITA